MRAAGELIAHRRQQGPSVDLVVIEVTIDEDSSAAGQDVKEKRPERQKRRGQPCGIRCTDGRVVPGVEGDDEEEYDRQCNHRRKAMDHAAVDQATDAEDLVAENGIREGQRYDDPEDCGQVCGDDVVAHDGLRDQGEPDERERPACDADQRESCVACGGCGVLERYLPCQHDEGGEEAARKVNRERRPHQAV